MKNNDIALNEAASNKMAAVFKWRARLIATAVSKLSLKPVLLIAWFDRKHADVTLQSLYIFISKIIGGFFFNCAILIFLFRMGIFA